MRIENTTYRLELKTGGKWLDRVTALHNHRNILHRIFWYATKFGVGAADRTMMLSSADHISGVVGMLRPLITGGRLRVFSIRREGFAELASDLMKQSTTILPIVNSVFRRFIDGLPRKSRRSAKMS